MGIPTIRDLASLAYQDILRRKKKEPFLIFVFFILSFIAARFIVITFEDLRVIIRQYHIHHFYYGIALISIAAWIALVSDRERMKSLASILFGVGLGLITDEIGLLLTCNSEGLNCNYFARSSFDAAVLISLALLAFIYFKPFWARIKSRASKIYHKVKKKETPAESEAPEG